MYWNEGKPSERAVILIIAGALVFRLILAFTLGLGVDESYSISVAHDLNLSYFDHPPLHYWIVHFFMPLLGDGQAARLPFVLIFVGTTWLLYRLTQTLFGASAGLWAVIALNLSAYFTLAGDWVLPDGPLMFFLVAAAYAIARALFSQNPPISPWKTWFVAGVSLGAAGLSKYHAILFVLGLLVFFATVPERRSLLRHPAPWVGATIALLISSPAIIWNAQHHWASLAFQAGRADIQGFPKIGPFVTNIGGQILWMLPWVFVPMAMASYNALRKATRAETSWFCLCLAMPTVLIFTFEPLWGDHGLPHWPMPGWLMLFPVLGEHLAREAALRSRPRTWAVTSAAALAVLTVVIVGDAAFGYSRLLFPKLFSRHDLTLQAFDWSPLRSELESRGLLKQKGLFIISTSWIDMGKIDLALHDRVPTQIFSDDKRQYAYRYSPTEFLGHDALIIGRPQHMRGVKAALSNYFSSIKELPPVVFGRSGMSEITLRVLYGTDLKEIPVRRRHAFDCRNKLAQSPDINSADHEIPKDPHNRAC
jgi:4-amino-4-deoxy-L-arabinose transferase-like glycosyltransferase